MYPVSVRIAEEHEDDVQSFEREELVGDATLFEFARRRPCPRREKAMCSIRRLSPSV